MTYLIYAGLFPHGKFKLEKSEKEFLYVFEKNKFFFDILEIFYGEQVKICKLNCLFDFRLMIIVESYANILFVYFFGGPELVGHSFAYVDHFLFLRDVWI